MGAGAGTKAACGGGCGAAAAAGADAGAGAGVDAGSGVGAAIKPPPTGSAKYPGDVAPGPPALVLALVAVSVRSTSERRGVCPLAKPRGECAWER
jgi:hypothetical protein